MTTESNMVNLSVSSYNNVKSDIELAMTLIKQALEVLRQWREYRKEYAECPAWGTTDNRLNEAFLRKWQNYTPHKKEIIDCLLMARKHLLYAMKKIEKE